MSAPAGPIWPSLRAAAAAFCPPFEIRSERPGALSLVLADPVSGEEIGLRYRSERGLFLRTYYLVAETAIAGSGPAQAGELVLRRGQLRWKGRKPAEAKRWRDRLSSPALGSALKRLQIERLSLAWEPERETWRFAVETLSGSATVTFFPPLTTPTPFDRDEAAALVEAIGALRSASRRPA